MANNIIKRVWNQNKMVNIEGLSGAAFQAESGGHTFQISGIDDTGTTVALSGTVTGVFRRPDNADIALTGSASGGVASVTLTDDCYAVPGRFGLTVFVTSGGQKTAVYAAIGTVASTNGGAVAGDTPQDVVDLINAIAAAVATIPADYTDLMAAIAPTYSPSALYPVGFYVWHDGHLYRCITAITTAESWTAGHWTAVALGNDVSDLKSALTNIENMSPIAVFDQTVSGTQMKTVSGLSIPAGEYDITVDSIVSSDTDAEICMVAFISNGTTNKSVNLPRGNNISRNITFTADIDTINFYASSSWPNGSGDTFAFTGFKLSQDTALVTKINSIDSDIDALNNNLSGENTELYAGVMYEKTTKTSYTEGENYKLADTGFSVYDANYTLKKFHVDPGAWYMIHSDHAFQFQRAENVPAENVP